LRTIHADPIIVAEPWRLRVIDEIEDALYKLNGLDGDEWLSLHNTGINLRYACSLEINDLDKFRVEVASFLKEVSDLYVIHMLSCDK